MVQTTGGLLMEGSARGEEILEQMQRDLDTYYLLGYTSPNPGDEQYHEIRVKAQKPRTRVRHPHGYLGRATATRQAEEILAALFYGHGENSQEISLDLAAGDDDDQQRPTVRIRVQIPIRLLDLTRGDGIHTTAMTLFVGVMAPSGRITTLRDYPVPIEIPSRHLEQARSQDFPVTLTVAVTAGTNRIAVGLWSDGSSVGSFATGELTPPGRSADRGGAPAAR
jgi:hypothetical protein